jgi:single-stranded DNA-binding protein
MRINQVVFSGHLYGKPEEKAGASRSFVKGRMRVYQGKDKPTIWLDLVCWSTYAAADLLKAGDGDAVTVSGRLTFNEWKTRAGEDRQGYGVTCETVEVHIGPDAHDIGAVERPLRDRPSAGSGTVDPEAGLDDIPF